MSLTILAPAGLSKVYQARGQRDRAIGSLREAVDACEEPQGDKFVMHPKPLLTDLAKEYAAA